MKLIVESVETPVDLIVEATGEGSARKVYIEGPFLQSEVVNRNRRVYPKTILDGAVNRYITEMVNTNRAVGELGHPEGPGINLDLISHRIVSLKEDGNNWIGKALLLNTPKGKIAQDLLEGGVRFGVSSRALGNLRPATFEGQSCQMVQEDLQLRTAADIVFDPSAPKAFVNGLMEDVDWVQDNATGEFVASAKKIFNESIRQKNRETVAIVLFEKFLDQLKTR